MRIKGLVAVMAALSLSACNADQSGGTGSSLGGFGSADGWTLERKSSQMDGEVLVASKRVHDGASMFDLRAECAGGKLNVVIESFTTDGEPNAYLTTMVLELFGDSSGPDGRIKLNGDTPTPLGELFDITEYNNSMSLRGGGGIQSSYARVNGITNAHQGQWNDIAALKSFLPFTVEVKNHGGTHELTFGRVDPLIQVFDACGGNGTPYVAPPAVEAATPEPPAPVEQATPAPPEPADETVESEPSAVEGGVEPVYTSPVPIRNDPPRYPPAAARAGIEGEVEVIFDIGTDGNVTNVEVSNSSRNRDLDRAAVEAVSKWTYTPAQEDGVPVASKLKTTLSFSN